MNRSFRNFLCLAPLIFLLASCAAPIGARHSSTRETYRQVERNGLNSGDPSADTHSLLQRYDLDEVFNRSPDEAVLQLHAKALATGERDILFALAEVSFLAAKNIGRSVKPWDSRDARDYYLGAAVYAYLFLFGNQDNHPHSGFDRRFRMACDFYNYGLGLALAGERKQTNAIVELKTTKRNLPVGAIDLRLDTSRFPWPLDRFDKFVLGDQYLVHGLSVRNRQAGIGAPLIAEESREITTGLRKMTPATVFLRCEGTLQDAASGKCQGSLELHSAFGPATAEIGNEFVPLETDLSVHMAYSLNQSIAWEIERLQFLSLRELVPADVYPTEPYVRGRIPVVFVHGTFSSPVWWAEMLNTLRADPELRKRYQFWFFIYNSSAPLVGSAGKLRKGIEARLKEFDPEASDSALQQMVVIGHSQGGLLTKLIVTDTEDKLWNSLTTKSIDELDLTPTQKEQVRALFFLKAMPCVKRAIFIATPHRGSYRAGGFIRSVIRRLVNVPATLAGRMQDLRSLVTQLKLPQGFDEGRLTSVDGMSPRSPVLQALAEMPIAPYVKAHSIIPVKGEGDIQDGNDGVVAYSSAHLENVDSEFVLRCSHSCQGTPAAIEEVRRILHLHLDAQPKINTVASQK